MKILNNAKVFSDEEIMNLIDKSSKKTIENVNEATTKNEVKNGGQKKMENQVRHLLVIGAGDGGCNIMSSISKGIKNTTSIAYNTSARGMNSRNFDFAVVPMTEDGSGKDRSYSKDVFKNGPYRDLINKVNNLRDTTNITYNLVTTTCDGGTGGGVSPNIAKFIDDNSDSDVPTIIIGVYPSMDEDAKSQYNTLSWQADIEKIGIPYMIFDNNHYANNPKAAAHININNDIVDAIKVFSGNVYGDTDISSIDNRDLLTIVKAGGDRICIFTSNEKLKVNQTLDDYIFDMIKKSSQPAPLNTKVYGLFVKGPKTFIDNLDTSITSIKSVYGDSQMFTHLEVSDDICITLMTSGSSSPKDRLYEMKQRYEDIMSAKQENSVKASDLLVDIKDPFIGLMKSDKKTSNETSLAALDI